MGNACEAAQEDVLDRGRSLTPMTPKRPPKGMVLPNAFGLLALQSWQAPREGGSVHATIAEVRCPDDTLNLSAIRGMAASCCSSGGRGRCNKPDRLCHTDSAPALLISGCALWQQAEESVTSEASQAAATPAAAAAPAAAGAAQQGAQVSPLAMTPPDPARRRAPMFAGPSSAFKRLASTSFKRRGSSAAADAPGSPAAPAAPSTVLASFGVCWCGSC